MKVGKNVVNPGPAMNDIACSPSSSPEAQAKYRPSIVTFAERVNCDSCGRASPAHLVQASAPCANVFDIGARHTVAAADVLSECDPYEKFASADSTTEVRWRYTTKGGRWAMVNFPNRASANGRWAFVKVADLGGVSALKSVATAQDCPRNREGKLAYRNYAGDGSYVCFADWKQRKARNAAG